MIDESGKILLYAVRREVVLKYCGQLAWVLALLTLVPLLVAAFEMNTVLVLRYAIVSGILLLLGWRYARMPAPDVIRANEALTITALAFLGSSLLMAWPMMAVGLSPVDAIFEAVSGVTTTGLSTLSGVSDYPASFLFLRAWMQWYGGLGFIVLSVALLLGHQVTARRLVSPVDSSESMMATARTYARRTLVTYLGLTLFGLAVVWPLSHNGFISVLHVLSSVSTGGFSMFDNSLAGLPTRASAIAIMLVSFLSAASLTLYWRAYHAGWRTGWRTLVYDVELRGLVLACLLVGAILGLLGWLHGERAPWYEGFMLGVSAQTTTGFFSTRDIAALDPASKLVMMVAMLIGGSVGSSAGGFKILRLVILLRAVQVMMRRVAAPAHAVIPLRLGDQKLTADDINRVLLLILLFISVVVISWLPFVLAGYAPLDALFEVISACGTVGLSTGITRPELSSVLKGVLCFDMLAGRMEIIAVLVVLSPRNWFGRRESV